VTGGHDLEKCKTNGASAKLLENKWPYWLTGIGIKNRDQ